MAFESFKYMFGDEGKTQPAGKIQETKLEQFASAIQKKEGWGPGTRSFRNNNPGNLRYGFQTGATGVDEKDFTIFSTKEEGFNALIADIKAKATGKTRTDLTPDSTLYDFAEVYAPEKDGNDPVAYAEEVAAELGVNPNTTLKDYFAFDQAQEVPDAFEVPRTTINPQVPDVGEVSKPTGRFASFANMFEEEEKEAVSETYQGYFYAPEDAELPPLNWFNKVQDLYKEPHQLVPFLAAGVEIFQLSDLLLSANRLRKGEETEEDLRKLEEYIEKESQDRTFGYKVLDVISMLPSFAGELYLTAGFATAGRLATVKGAKEGLKYLMTKTGKELLEKRLAEKGLTRRVTAEIVGRTVQTPVAGATRIWANTVRKQLNSTLTVEDIEDKESLHRSLTKAFGEQWVETLSEFSGGILTGIVQKTATSRLVSNQLIKVSLFAAFKKVNPGTKAETLRSVINKVGYHGVVGEMFEERVGEVGHGILNKLGLSDQEFAIPSGEQLAVELVAFSVPGVGIVILNKALEEMTGLPVKTEPPGPDEGPEAVPEVVKEPTSKEIMERIIKEKEAPRPTEEPIPTEKPVTEEEMEKLMEPEPIERPIEETIIPTEFEKEDDIEKEIKLLLDGDGLPVEPIKTEAIGSTRYAVFVRDKKSGDFEKVEFVKSKLTGEYSIERTGIKEDGTEFFIEGAKLDELQKKYDTKDIGEIAKRFTGFDNEAELNAEFISKIQAEPEEEKKDIEPREVELSIQGKVGPFYQLDTLDSNAIEYLHGKIFANSVGKKAKDGTLEKVTVYRAGKPGEELKDGTFLTAKKSDAEKYLWPEDSVINNQYSGYGGTILYEYKVDPSKLISIDNADFSELVYKDKKVKEKITREEEDDFETRTASTKEEIKGFTTAELRDYEEKQDELFDTEGEERHTAIIRANAAGELLLDFQEKNSEFVVDVKHPKRPKGVSIVEIEVLEYSDGKWGVSEGYNFGNSGYGGPISGKFNSKQEAIDSVLPGLLKTIEEIAKQGPTARTDANRALKAIKEAGLPTEIDHL